MKGRIATVAAVAGAMLLASPPGRAFYASGPRWPAGSNIVMNLQQGAPSASLIDGSADWDAVTEGALAAWNPFLNGVSFRVAKNAASSTGLRNNVNNVFWADDVYGQSFGDAIAVTQWLYYTESNRMAEADVMFDRKRNWNSYRGNLRAASGGGTLIDLRRTALHEFGHVLGLTHPNEHGQTVTAIMNSRVSNIDTLQADDTNGVASIYGGSAAAPTPPPSRDTLASGTRLSGGQSITSSNGRYRLLYQNDGNLVFYDDVDKVALWSSGTTGTAAGQALMQADGNFVVYTAQGAAVWASGTPGNDNARLVVQNDGNLVLYRADNQPAWELGGRR
nr:hypothetical protein [uncultured bacterium]